MPSQKLFFKNASGNRLAARLDLPADGKPVAYVLFAHCFTCSKNLKAVANLSRALTEARFAVLRFDFTGLGESEGEFAETTFSSNVEDLVTAARFLESDYQAPQVLLGHSLGGAAVLQAASQIPSAAAVATINAPAEPEHVSHLLESKREVIEREGEAEVTLAGRTFRIKKQFLDDLAETQMKDKIQRLGKALLIFHSPVDEIVSIDNAAKIFQAARHSKSFVSLDQADHLLSRERDSLYVGEVLSTWARKYIEAPEKTPKPVEESNQVVVLTEDKGLRSEIMVRGHSLVADEPLDFPGGTDAGPTPYDLLLTGLGACASMTMRMYADRKNLPLKAAIVRLTHAKIHARDCEDCETKEGKIDRIEREIELIGSLDEEQRRKLVEIADKCPVHKTLHSEISITTRLKE